MTRRWPQINFDGIAVGVLQPTMGALMARRSVQSLVGEFVAAGGSFRQIAVEPPRSQTSSLGSITGSGDEPLRAGRFIFACGPWLPKLFPDVIGRRIVPTRQDQTAVIKQRQIGRAHVCTPVTNAHLVCRLLLENKKKQK